MRILALSTWWPEPDNNGSRLRISRLLRALAAEHEVHLVAFTQEPAENVTAKRLHSICASVRAVTRPTRPIHLIDRMAAFAKGQPASTLASWSDEFATTAIERANTIRPDVVVAFQIDVAGVACQIPGVPRVLEELELTLLYEQFVRQEQMKDRMRYGLTWLQHRHYVADLLSHFDACTVVSAHEAQMVRQLAPPTMPVVVVPNGADVSATQPINIPEPDTLIYPGSLTFTPNFDAMDYFLAEIYPAIQRLRPNVELRITGTATDAQRDALSTYTGVRFTGYIDDIKTLIARTWAEVVPLRYGGGTRLKVLEALALGTPVVATSKGVEGLDLEHGKHVLIADTPREFAAATILLLTQPGLRAYLSQEGSRLIAARYDWRAIGRQLNALLCSIVAQRSQGYTSHAA